MRDPDTGMKVVHRSRRDHLLVARYNNQSRVAESRSRWSGYADPVKQAMADAGLIPQSPVIGEMVNSRGMVKAKEARTNDEKLYRGKDNGKPRGNVVVQCTKPQYPTPTVVGSFWPRVRGENGELVVKPLYSVRESVGLESVVDRIDPTLVVGSLTTLEEFKEELKNIATKGAMARRGR